MITTDILFLLNVVLLFLVAILAVKLADCGTRLNRVEESCDVLENVAEGLSDRCDAHKKSIEYLSKSVRELNGVVEAAVNVKEQTSDNKPDTKALVSGWDADEPEPIQQLISKKELMMHLVKAQLNFQRIEPMPQQCILPFQQTPSGAILPLWYMNRNLENM